MTDRTRQSEKKLKQAQESRPSERMGMLILVSGPSGTGKGTLCERLIKQDKNILFSVSATTRPRREYEQEGVHYCFISDSEFDDMLSRDELLEYACVHDHRYGTPGKPVLEAIKNGQDILLDVDSQGALNVMRKIKNCVSIFILPPSFSSLKERLRTRNTDDEEEIKKRLRSARAEIAKYTRYDYALINDNLDQAFERLLCIVSAERQSTSRYHPLIPEN